MDVCWSALHLSTTTEALGHAILNKLSHMIEQEVSSTLVGLAGMQVGLADLSVELQTAVQVAVEAKCGTMTTQGVANTVFS